MALQGEIVKTSLTPALASPAVATTSERIDGSAAIVATTDEQATEPQNDRAAAFAADRAAGAARMRSNGQTEGESVKLPLSG